MLSIILPQELIQVIIEALQSDQFALRSCSLVCRAWTPLAQRCIFSSISVAPSLFGLSNAAQPSLLTRFHEIVSTSPHLLRHVRSLEFDPTLDAVQYLFTPDHIQLEEIKIVNFLGDMSKADDVIAAMLPLPSVTRLTVREGPAYPTQILPILRHCPHVRELSMSRVTLDGMVQCPGARKMSIRLRSLAVSRVTPEILSDLAANVVDMTQLRHFTVLFHPFFYDQGRLERSIPIVQDILRSMDGMLEYLRMDTYLYEPLAKLIPIARLRSLQIDLPSPRLKADVPHATAERMLKWLVDSLQGASLDCLVIQKFPITEVSMNLAGQIDRMLGQSSLTRLYVEIPSCPNIPARELFPILQKRGVLSQFYRIPVLPVDIE